MNVPNILTVIRIFLAPLFFYVYFYGGEDRYLISGAIFALAGITDIVDGYIARKYNLITKLGKILDPVADKLMQATAFVCLYFDGILPLAILLFFILKELLMLIGGAIIIKRARAIESSRWFGKFATVAIYAAVLPAVLVENLNEIYKIASFSVAIVASMFSLIMYLVERKNVIKK